jgi:hypothetical protein
VRVVETYTYHGPAGEVLYKVDRYDPKKFSQARHDGAGGWISNLDGVERVPYMLPLLLRTIREVATCSSAKARRMFTAS